MFNMSKFQIVTLFPSISLGEQQKELVRVQPWVHGNIMILDGNAKNHPGGFFSAVGVYGRFEMSRSSAGLPYTNQKKIRVLTEQPHDRIENYHIKKNQFCHFGCKLKVYRPQNLSPGVLFGVESDFEVQNDEK